MALITCPECGKEISDKATTCPNCGAPVNTTNTPDPVPQPNTNYSEKYRSPQNDKSKDKVTNPFSAIFVAYRLALCSFTAPIGWPTMMAGLLSF